MAGNSTETEASIYFNNVAHFPAVINGRINIEQFLVASSDLVAVVERLGKVFAPVKYDMQGNISKIRKVYSIDNDSCLLELILHETSHSPKAIAAEAVLWLNRALLFFEIVFREVIARLQKNSYETNMTEIFNVAYENSVKKYHNWVTQQLFSYICKLSPTLPQIMKSFQVDSDLKSFEERLTNFNITLHLVRTKIDDFYKDNNLFDSNK